MNMPAIWTLATAARPVIATVDTGVDPAFPDLRDVLVPGWDLVEDDQDTTDTHGHGTDVAIILAANADNGYGLAGACPMCRIMPVKVSGDGEASQKAIAAGIRWAVDHGARIVNVSLSATGPPDRDLKAAVDYAGVRGAVLVASAGNDGDATQHVPAALPGVVSVAATDRRDALYPWSTRGGWVDLAAPGCEWGEEMCGTSYTPPLVTGAIGLLLAADPNLTPVQAVNALRATAARVAGIGGGRIDVRAAADALGIGPAPAPLAGKRPVAQQEVLLQSGSFGAGFRTSFTVAAGPFTAILRRANARACIMQLGSASGVYLTWRSAPNELDISANVAAGRYVLDVRCPDAQKRGYSLLVRARLLSKS
jgi:subtilisin family serine protease